MSRSLFLLIAILLCSVSLSFCQDFPLQHFTIEDGLPSNNVYDIYRDYNGYLWISTDKGVARYNGNIFEIFTTNDGLPENEVFFTSEDYDGRLWLSTYNGKLCYYKDGIFHTEANTPFLKWKLNNSFIKTVYNEFDSSVTISFNEQYKFVNIRKGKVKVYEIDYPKKGILNLYQTLIKKMTDSSFRLGFPYEQFFLDKNGKIVNTVLTPGDTIRTSFQCQQKTYLVTDSFILSGDYEKLARVAKFHFNKFNIWRVYFEGKNKFYATNDGLIINDSIRILNGNTVSSITQDNTGNYWIGTLNNGIYSGYLFNARQYKNAYKGSIKYSCARNGKVYFTTDYNNLYCFNKNDKTSCLFDYEKFSHKKSDQKADQQYYLDSTGKYYAFYGKDYFVIDDIMAPVKKITAYKNSTGSIKSIFPSQAGNYFRAIRCILYTDNKKIKPGIDIHNIREELPNPAKPNRIFSAAVLGNNIWYSTTQNMYKLVNNEPQLQSQFNKLGIKYFDFFGKNLVGYTYTNQLVICSDIEGNFKIDSLPFEQCIWNRLYKIDDYHILASTNNLYRLLTIDTTGSTPKLISFVVENPYMPLQAESVCIDSANCYFFKNGTIVSVSTKKLFLKPAPPKPYFQILKTKKKSLIADTGLTIAYNESKYLSLSYSTVAFGGKRVFCQYSITKNETDGWRNVEGGEINLNNLGYGKFTIKLRAKTLSSDYSEPVVFTLTITDPYWATWWFITLSIILAASIIAIIILFRIRYIVLKKQAAHTNEIKYIKAEFKSLNALMNPHFIFNTLNNVQSLFNGNEKRAANEYLRIFADLIRQNMHNISKDLIPLQKEMDLVANYLILEKLRFEDQLNYNIDITTDTDLSDIMVPPLLIQPLVENSIKHGILPKGGNGNINISIYETNNVMHIKIKDNGVGMKSSENRKEKTHESFGIDNIRQRIDQLSILQNKKIEFSLGEERDNLDNLLWTVITISIPI